MILQQNTDYDKNINNAFYLDISLVVDFDCCDSNLSVFEKDDKDDNTMVYEWDEKDKDGKDKDYGDNVDYNDTDKDDKDKDDEDKDHKDKDDLDDTCFTCSCTGGLAGQSWAEVLGFWKIWNPDDLTNMKS